MSKTILVAEDSASVRKFIVLALKLKGYNVIAVEDGMVALETFSKEKIDLLLTDLNMPNMDGLEALKKIREHDQNCKIVIVSAMGQKPFIKDAMVLGAKSFILKPFKEDHVVKTLNRI